MLQHFAKTSKTDALPQINIRRRIPGPIPLRNCLRENNLQYTLENAPPSAHNLYLSRHISGSIQSNEHTNENPGSRQ